MQHCDFMQHCDSVIFRRRSTPIGHTSVAVRQPLMPATVLSLILPLTLIGFQTAIAVDEPVATSQKPANLSFDEDVKPILQTRCIGCHGSEKQSGDLRIDRLLPDMIRGNDAETWHDLLNRINRGEMPPQKATQLTERERATVVGWLTMELDRSAEARRGQDQAVLRRLNRYEYRNTVRDLLGMNLDASRDLPPEPTSADGFQNNGAALGISPLQMELYLTAARSALSKVIVTGERPEVYRYRAEKSETVRKAKRKVINRLLSGDRFVARMTEFPRDGEIIVRVRAGADIKPGTVAPRMRVALGLKADVQAPEKTIAEVDVRASVDDPQVYEFRGRIEDFPLPGHNPKFPGFQITVYHVGSPAAKQAKPVVEKLKKSAKDKAADRAVDKAADRAVDRAAAKAAKAAAKAAAAADEQSQQPAIVVEWVEFEGPLFDRWPPQQHQEILFPSDDSGNEQQYVRQILARFLPRAYRRSVSSVDIDPLVRFFNVVRPRHQSFEESIQEVLAMSLISPDFLYLVERGPLTDTVASSADSAPRRVLTDFELASRLSYFLWSSMPDERLFALASNGELRDADVLDSEVARMLADSKSQEFVAHFSDQWFGLAALDRVAVNPEFYPNFAPRLKSDMRRETQLFFAEILRENRSCLDLLDSDFTYLNRPLAEHYGLPLVGREGPLGLDFERVTLSPDAHRGGILTHGSILLANSNGEESHPIKRAVWLLDRLLDRKPPPPPPDVPDLNVDEPSFVGLTLKQKLEAHRAKPACLNCHQGIDPWGIPFEQYDATGRWRGVAEKRKRSRRQDVQTIEDQATLPDGVVISGLSGRGGLKSYLASKQRSLFGVAVAKRVLAYSLGRSLTHRDEDAVRGIAAEFDANDLRIRPLIVAVVRSELFQTK
jgi:mono/diheme cytochrome c family protein